MDPKQQISQMDPKLREMYDRVMAVNVPPVWQAADAPQTNTPGTQPNSNPRETPAPASPSTQDTTTPQMPTQTPGQPEPTPMPESIPSPTPAPETPAPNANVNVNDTSMQSTIPLGTVSAQNPQTQAVVSPQKISTAFIATAQKPKSGNKIMPILIAFLAIIFFAAYTIFWAKFFKLPIPYLPF